MRKLAAALAGAITLTVTVAGPAGAQGQGCTVALIPGLTTDAFYITMRKGAEMAAKAVGCELLFQGGPEFNPTVQVPVLQAVIARKPDGDPDRTHRQAAADRTAAAGGRCRHPGDHRRHLHRRRQVPGRQRPGRLPALLHRHRQRAGRLSSPAWRWPGTIGERGQGLRLQRQARDPHHRPARGRLQGWRCSSFPNVTVLDTQFNDNDANKASAQVQAVFARNQDLAGVFGANLFSAIGAADGVKALGKSGAIRVVAFDAPNRIVDDLKSGLDRPRRRPASGRDRLLRRDDRLCRDQRPVGPAADRHRCHDHDQGQYRRSRT